MGNHWNSPFDSNCVIDSLYLGRHINSDFQTGVWTNLTRVAVGDKVTSLNGSLFSGCTKLARVHFGKNIETMGASVFRNC